LRSELAATDPESAARIKGNDLYRLTRAVEITRLTGRPMAEFAAPVAPRSLYRFVTIGVERPREELAARIAVRVDAMMEAGLADEVAALHRRGRDLGDPGMKAIGYREFFQGPAGGFEDFDLKAIAEAIKLDTRRYAKRQMTFFRRLPGIEWIKCDAVALSSHLGSIVQEPRAGL
jgi:tRNA dimethylallyltransferase